MNCDCHPPITNVSGIYTTDKLIYLVKHGQRDSFYKVHTIRCIKWSHEETATFRVSGFRIKKSLVGEIIPIDHRYLRFLCTNEELEEFGFGHLFSYDYLGDGATKTLTPDHIIQSVVFS